MRNRTKGIILFIAVSQVIIILGLLALPPVVQAIPGRYRVWLQENHPALGAISEEVIAQVAPVATALPAAQQVSETQIDISALIAQPVDTVASEGAGDVTLNVTQEAAPVQEVEAAEESAVPAATPTLAATETPAPTPTPMPLPKRVMLDGMGVVKQSFNNCGPANLTQVLNWYGSPITQEDVASYLKPNPEDRNVSPWQISDYVNERMPGYSALTRSGGDLDLLKRFLAAGFPVVIEKGYELPESGWWGHYLTLYGYDDDLQELYSQDTYLGPFDGSGRVDSYREFLPYWQEFNNTFYVVYKPEQEATVKSLMGEEMFDDFKMWQMVARIAEQETVDRPDDVFSWFNLGTALTRMGGLTGEAQYYQGGVQAFDRAREIGLPPRMLWYQFEPYLAYLRTDRYQDIIDLANATLETQGGRNVEETFWYKGHALAYLGDIPGAIAAYKAALGVNKNFYPAQISLDSLGG
ncbi:MAG: C39 family peptidase [Anaerolineae bacterium]|nr:C39 family peptidase [Promineifilum sp.]MCZ2114342.1 C39 family peptidase [Anaerolineae bacterium]HNS39100.1 C39 family peptidase [Promineifilum sp.]